MTTRIVLDTYYYSSPPESIPYAIDGFQLAQQLHALGFSNIILYAGEDPGTAVPDYVKVVLKENHKHEGDTRLDKI